MLTVALALLVCVIGAHGACPNNWKSFNAGGGVVKCYDLNKNQKATWFEAVSACQAINAYLARPTSSGEINAVKDLMNNNSVDKAWIGANDVAVEGTFRWAETDDSVGSGFWNSNEPNNKDNNENCAEQLKSGKWNDGNCRETRKFLCERLG